MTAAPVLEDSKPTPEPNPMPRLPPFPMPPWRPGGPSPSYRQQVVLCPTCRKPVPGLLAGCTKTKCRAADIAYDWAFDRALDI